MALSLPRGATRVARTVHPRAVFRRAPVHSTLAKPGGNHGSWCGASLGQGELRSQLEPDTVAPLGCSGCFRCFGKSATGSPTSRPDLDARIPHWVRFNLDVGPVCDR